MLRVMSDDRFVDHPAETRLLDYLVGDLPPSARSDVRRHVDGCRACRESLESLAHAVDDITQLPTTIIPHDQLRSPMTRRGVSSERRPALIGLLIAVAAAAVVTGILNLPSKPQPATQSFTVDRTAFDRLALDRRYPVLAYGPATRIVIVTPDELDDVATSLGQLAAGDFEVDLAVSPRSLPALAQVR